MRRFSSVLLTTICLLLIVSVTSVQADDKWTKVQSKNFTLIGNGNEKDIRQVATKLEQFRHVFSQLFPNMRLTTPIPTTVMVFKDNKSFAPFKSGNVVGYFQPGEDVNYIALTTETRGIQTPYTIIFHEYVHLMLNNSMSNNIPPWFNEGLAEYYSTFEIKDNIKVILGNLIDPHILTLRQRRMLPLKTLFAVDHKSDYYNEKHKQNIFYAQSWLLMHYLIQTEDGKRVPYINKFLSSLNKGVELDKAFFDAFQMSVEQMENELYEYLRKTSFIALLLTFKNKLVFDTEITSKPITEADSQAYLGDLLAHTNSPFADKYFLKAIELEPNHAMAQVSLGMFYARQERLTEAKKFLEKAIATDSKNYLAYYYYAKAISFEKIIGGYVQKPFSPDELKTMRGALKKAIDLSPTFPDSYRFLAFINLNAQEEIDESIELLKRALTFSPGKQELNFMLAQCYMAKQDFKLAKELAEPIARSAPNENIKTHAQMMLDYIKKIEDRNAEFEALSKKQEEQAKNEAGVGLQNASVDSATTKKQNDATGNVQIGLHKPAEGEKQVRGSLIRIDCISGKSGVIVVKAGEKLYRFYKPDMNGIRFVSFTTEMPLGGKIGCGAVKNQPEAILTFRDLKDKTTKYDGEVFIIEFISKDFPQQP